MSEDISRESYKFKFHSLLFIYFIYEYRRISTFFQDCQSSNNNSWKSPEFKEISNRILKILENVESLGDLGNLEIITTAKYFQILFQDDIRSNVTIHRLNNYFKLIQIILEPDRV